MRFREFAVNETRVIPFRGKSDISDVLADVEKAFRSQRNMDSHVQEALGLIKNEYETNKFKFPGVTSQYRKTVSPIESLYFEAIMPWESVEEATRYEIFSTNLLKEHREEIIAALQSDIQRIKKLYDLGEEFPAARHALKPVHQELYHLLTMKNYLDKDIEHIDTPDLD